MSLRHSLALDEVFAKAPYAVRQSLLGAAYVLVPRRLPGLVPLIAVTARDLLKVSRPLLPDPERALEVPDGLCGLAGRIGVAELIEGYASGMFVMSHIGPLKWWAPRHRMVLFFDKTRIEKTTRRLLRTQRFKVTFDRAFQQVMEACANPRTGGTPLTWITSRVRKLFERAHAAGHAHSVEVWDDQVLVGGAYGLAVGQAFFTESQFHTVRDASKVGFAILNRHLQAWGFVMNDGKHPTRYLADCGMKPITRAEFSTLTKSSCARQGRMGKWTVDLALLDDGWIPAETNGVRMDEALPTGTECEWSIDELMTTKRSSTW